MFSFLVISIGNTKEGLVMKFVAKIFKLTEWKVLWFFKRLEFMACEVSPFYYVSPI